MKIDFNGFGSNFILVCLLFILMDSTVLSTSDSAVQLFVTPNAGYSTENIEVQCQLTPSSIISPLSSSKFDNIYLSVKTDSVRPSGILLQFDDSTDRCQGIPEKKFHIDICNATLIRIHISHTVINETLQTIDYVCSKGNIYVSSSYRILRKTDPSSSLWNIYSFDYFRRSFCTFLRSNIEYIFNNIFITLLHYFPDQIFFKHHSVISFIVH